MGAPIARPPASGAVLLTGATTGLAASGVAVLLIDTDRVAGTIDERIYGQFLEHINHSVVDGLYAEQVRGQGFEGTDFADYWRPVGDQSAVSLVEAKFEQRIRGLEGGRAGSPPRTVASRDLQLPRLRGFVQLGH